MLKRELRYLENVLYHARRAEQFVNEPSLAIARRGKMATTTLHYVRPDGTTLYEIEKGIGSDLCGLSEAIRLLKAMLESER